MDFILQRSQQLIQLQRYKDAEKELKMLLSQNPNDADALALYSICQAEQGQLVEALQTIKDSISKQPDNDYLLYLQALYLLKLDNTKEAERAIQNAVAFNPRSADYFGLWATIKLAQKEFQQCLEHADKGLAIDPENLQCLNMRSNALFKLNKKDEVYSTIQEALAHDPENEYTHTNLGWGLLERGDHKKALEHFREALKINPNFEYAKAGLIEGLKARYFFYRLFLKYAFWIANLKGKGQWAVIIGMYVGIRILNAVADTNPTLAFILKPIVYLYIAFALSTWVIEPLSNLFLRLNLYGRFALSRDDIRASTFVGLSFLMGIVSLICFPFNKQDVFLIAGVVGITMMIPLGSMFHPTKKRSRTMLIGYTILVGTIGVLSILSTAAIGGTTIFFPVYVIGVIVYGWVSNFINIKMR